MFSVVTRIDSSKRGRAGKSETQREREKPEGTRWRSSGRIHHRECASVQDEHVDFAHADRYRRMLTDTSRDRFYTLSRR